ncbi:MAG: SCO family protein [Melioribacteraceae bacterium]|jgi:protein SCO1/2|nr:SCO family protein [Melioribacteraceae bacterium]
MKKRIGLFFLLIILLTISCGDNFPVIEDLGNTDYRLVDQYANETVFPDNIKGKIVIAGYIFTNCPDICPLTTNNMRLIQERLKGEGIEGVQFISISFDPDNDSPEVLKKFAEIRNLDLSNWTFLTGEKPVVDELMKHVGVLAVPGDSTVFPSGKVSYYYIHTDRIQLIDEEGKIRKNYPGSSINIDEIVNDVKQFVR